MKIVVNKIKIKAIDERGALHYFNTDRSGEFLLVYRKMGSVSGQHFHKGISVNKNPEIMLLVHGTAQLIWKEVDGVHNGILELVAPVQVNIPAGIWHQTNAKTDIIFLELNSLVDGSEDTHRL